MRGNLRSILYTLPGGAVELGETLHEAVVREVREETQLVIEPVALAGTRDVIVRGRAKPHRASFRHLMFCARWLSGQPVLNEELDDARWLEPAALAGLKTTDGLAKSLKRLRADRSLMPPCSCPDARAYHAPQGPDA